MLQDELSDVLTNISLMKLGIYIAVYILKTATCTEQMNVILTFKYKGIDVSPKSLSISPISVRWMTESTILRRRESPENWIMKLKIFKLILSIMQWDRMPMHCAHGASVSGMLTFEKECLDLGWARWLKQRSGPCPLSDASTCSSVSWDLIAAPCKAHKASKTKFMCMCVFYQCPRVEMVNLLSISLWYFHLISINTLRNQISAIKIFKI